MKSKITVFANVILAINESFVSNAYLHIHIHSKIIQTILQRFHFKSKIAQNHSRQVRLKKSQQLQTSNPKASSHLFSVLIRRHQYCMGNDLKPMFYWFQSRDYSIFESWHLFLKGQRFITLYNQKVIQMSKEPEGPFIICRNEQSSASFDFLPAIKVRKPTKHSWSAAESFHYVTFLKENLEAMESKEQRKNLKVFSLMAKIIKTRTSTQVKSHHQKLQRKYGKITTIIAKVSQFLSREPYVMKKDAETSIDIKEEPEEKEIISYCTPQVLEQDDWRGSQGQLVFFEEESDNNYLTFEGNRIFQDEEPLI